MLNDGVGEKEEYSIMHRSGTFYPNRFDVPSRFQSENFHNSVLFSYNSYCVFTIHGQKIAQ